MRVVFPSYCVEMFHCVQDRKMWMKMPKNQASYKIKMYQQHAMITFLGLCFLVLLIMWLLTYRVKILSSPEPQWKKHYLIPIPIHATNFKKFTKNDIFSLTPLNISQYPRRPPYVSGMRSACLAFDDSGVALEGVSYQDLTDAQKRSVYCLPAFMILGNL